MVESICMRAYYLVDSHIALTQCILFVSWMFVPALERLDLADHLLSCGLDLRCVLARMVCVRTYPVLIPRSFYGYLRFNLSEQ